AQTGIRRGSAEAERTVVASVERGRELDRAAERRVVGGQSGEHPGVAVVARAVDTERRRRLEAEAGVVGRVAEDEYERLACLVGQAQRLTGQRAADPAPLMGGRDAERAELQRPELPHPHP